ncbi:uncharacterized protein [Procambarus clarkii]|uniref:uncharacterized protein n=1 Tax=Procambarus clarkii TaxID=6728 RepID=UPI003743AC40
MAALPTALPLLRALRYCDGLHHAGFVPQLWRLTFAPYPKLASSDQRLIAQDGRGRYSLRYLARSLRLSATPHTELDYGTLLCWGSNAVGRQRQPCVFHVFPAGRPDPVHNCSAYNLTVSVVNVRCVAGFDGGLPQTFVLELYEPRSNRLLANVTNKVPTFAVPGLASGVAFMGVIYSTNEKGRGEMVSLQVYTVKDMPERPLDVPVCRGGQTVYHGVAKYEQVNIPCRLDAHPKPLAFRWTFNNSGESVDIPALF